MNLLYIIARSVQPGDDTKNLSDVRRDFFMVYVSLSYGAIILIT